MTIEEITDYFGPNLTQDQVNELTKFDNKHFKEFTLKKIMMIYDLLYAQIKHDHTKIELKTLIEVNQLLRDKFNISNDRNG